MSPDRSFSHTDYTYNDVIELNINLAREILLLNGGQITGSGDNEVWHIPSQGTIMPPILEQWPDQPNDPPQFTISLEGVSGLTVTLHARISDLDGIRRHATLLANKRNTIGYSTGGNSPIRPFATEKKPDLRVKQRFTRTRMIRGQKHDIHVDAANNNDSTNVYLFTLLQSYYSVCRDRSG